MPGFQDVEAARRHMAARVAGQSGQVADLPELGCEAFHQAGGDGAGIGGAVGHGGGLLSGVSRAPGVAVGRVFRTFRGRVGCPSICPP